MKIIIRHAKTGQFLQGDGNWTQNLKEARIFKRSTEALDYCQYNHCDQYQILLKTGDTGTYDLVLFDSSKTSPVAALH
jgi:hypothetical protein